MRTLLSLHAQNWKELGAPITQEAGADEFVFLTEKRSFKFPINPPQMNNHGNYIVRLGHVVKWLGEQAEAAGVEVYPGIAAASVLYDDKTGAVVRRRRQCNAASFALTTRLQAGVATHDVGIGRDGKKKDSYEPGMHLRGRLTIFGEGIIAFALFCVFVFAMAGDLRALSLWSGCRGSLTRGLEQRFQLRDPGAHQTYGIGVKELWEVDAKVHEPGKIQHTIGWPLPNDLYGGSFLYHLLDGGKPLVALGFVVSLDYRNPYTNPYRIFQQFKHHPSIAAQLEGGTCLQYGARAISEGGYQSLPRLSFPGGVLIGDTAGTLNTPKIKVCGFFWAAHFAWLHLCSCGARRARTRP